MILIKQEIMFLIFQTIQLLFVVDISGEKMYVDFKNTYIC